MPLIFRTASMISGSEMSPSVANVKKMKVPSHSFLWVTVAPGPRASFSFLRFFLELLTWFVDVDRTIYGIHVEIGFIIGHVSSLILLFFPVNYTICLSVCVFLTG